VYKVYVALAATGYGGRRMTTGFAFSRRRLLQGAAVASIASAIGWPRISLAARQTSVRPLPLASIRLMPSPWQRAVESNRSYLRRLDPDRLLHNFRQQAGLAPKADPYGGWEGETIAGHSLGHYLSACSLMHAQTGDADCRARAAYIVSELAACQHAGGDGYVAGFTRKNDSNGALEPGRRVMEELARGEVRSSRFYLNGCWAPFYNWHKLFAGLLDADRHCGTGGALRVAAMLAGYIDQALAPLDAGRMQTVLGTEFGGMSEVLAELSFRSRDPRWLRLAERFHDHLVLDPLVAGRDELAYLHANTQIPKLIGLARHAELTGNARELEGARFFWRAVTRDRSYVIGGNSDRECFQEPGSISRYITEQTCESCNTYNMLKLTRSLFAAEPRAGYFDYYERAHLNHVLAQHRPDDGMFAYMIPLISGAKREWSQPFDSFWCCVGTGMESHAKHGDSIFWQDPGALYVNLFIPAVLEWEERDARVVLETGYPFDDRVGLRFERIGTREPFELAVRLPGWCESPAAQLDGKAVPAARGADGYLRIRRRWRRGDALELELPMSLRYEATTDDPATIALLRGPLVLAADLGSADSAYDGPEPALIGDDVLATISTIDASRAAFASRGSARPADLSFGPFFSQYDRRTAVYFRRYSPAAWERAVARLAQERERATALDARSLDVIRLGVEDDERRHGLTSELSYAVTYRFRPGRDARSGGFIEFEAAVRDEPLVLRATYWGGERDRLFHIEVDGVRIATQRLQAEQPGEFFDRDYALPAILPGGKSSVRVRIQPEGSHTAGPLFGCRILPASTAA
jgi:uncharacterized protein